MPYIKEDRRPILNRIVNDLASVIKVDGDLNYVLFTLCKRHIEPSYNNYKNYLGELAECANEIRRRMLVPYEERKIKDNGDITQEE